MRWTVVGETHGDEKDIDKMRAALSAASKNTIVFMEALPVGRFVDGEKAWRVAANFSASLPDENVYICLARECQKKGVCVYGLERTSHRIPSCYSSGLQHRVRCAVHRACLPSKRRCIESDWVDDIWQCDELTARSHLLIVVGRLHVAHLQARLTARALLEHAVTHPAAL